MSLRRTNLALKGPLAPEGGTLAETEYPLGTLVYKHGREAFNAFVAAHPAAAYAKKKGKLGRAALVEFQDGHTMLVSETELEKADAVTLPADLRDLFPEDHPHKSLESVEVTGSEIDSEHGVLIEVGDERNAYSFIAWGALK